MAYGFWGTAGSTPIGQQTVPIVEELATIDIVKQAAARNDVEWKELWRMIGCETQWTYDPKIQSKVILWYGRELSFGLAQIHLPSHPDVTHEEATDPYFAAEFIASNWKEHRDWWKCKI